MTIMATSLPVLRVLITSVVKSSRKSTKNSQSTGTDIPRPAPPPRRRRSTLGLSLMPGETDMPSPAIQSARSGGLELLPLERVDSTAPLTSTKPHSVVFSNPTY